MGLRPGPLPAPVALSPPGSKSIAQRALVCAALTGGETRLGGLPEGGDVGAARGLAARVAIGCAEEARDRLRIQGRPPGPAGGWEEGSPLEVGESGTLARLASAAAGLCGRPGASLRLQGRGSLERRSSPALFQALERAGVSCAFERGRGTWPVEVVPCGPPAEVLLERPASSQEVSSLLIALAAHPGRRSLSVEGPIPSRPYVGLTLRVLANFGVEVDLRAREGGEAFALAGPLRAPGSLRVEPDASSAAVALAAACLVGGELTVPGLPPTSGQGDVRIEEHLRAFGCRAGGGEGALRAGGPPRRGAVVDLTGEPDLAPVLAAVAAAVALRAGDASIEGSGESLLTGLGTLPGKESDRIAVLARGLASLGVAVETGADFLRIGPGRVAEGDRLLHPEGDHRMAFCFALLGLVRPRIDVGEPGCVGKSWPGFWEDLAAAGFRVAPAPRA